MRIRLVEPVTVLTTHIETTSRQRLIAEELKRIWDKAIREKGINDKFSGRHTNSTVGHLGQWAVSQATNLCWYGLSETRESKGMDVGPYKVRTITNRKGIPFRISTHPRIKLRRMLRDNRYVNSVWVVVITEDEGETFDILGSFLGKHAVNDSFIEAFEKDHRYYSVPLDSPIIQPVKELR